MTSKIRVGIVGYGNLGKGTELALSHAKDMTGVGVFTRRNPSDVKTLGLKAFTMSDLSKMEDKIDLLILCGGSATDLPEMTPTLAEKFNVVDSFDNHGEIPNHFKAVDSSAIKGKKVAVISAGWDPGLFSLNRLIAQAVLPQGSTYTFWGKGISQGHSDAVRRVNGVADARQYTIPIDTALNSVRMGESPVLSPRERHKRVCYVVAKDGADKNKIEDDIVNMEGYFADYNTEVHFITQQELNENHTGMPHGGKVLHSGKTGVNQEHNQVIEFGLTLDSNPEFTSSVLLACGRAAYKMASAGSYGCKTFFDIPLGLLSDKSPTELRRELL